MFSTASLAAATAAFALFSSSVADFNPASKANLAMYWGAGNNQQSLQSFCTESTVDIIPIGFINKFPAQANGWWAEVWGNHGCWGGTDAYYTTNPGYPTGHQTAGNDVLPFQCPEVVQDIPICQTTYKKKILLSLGGEWNSDTTITGSNYDLSGATDGINFARLLWGAYGPYNASSPAPRPLGNSIVVDGFDFDIEHAASDHTSDGYIAMINELRRLMKIATLATGRQFLITGAPQCALPELNMGSIINAVTFDALFIQFYNTLACAASTSGFNYNQWARTLNGSYPGSSVTANANTKLYIGLPANTADTAYASHFLQPSAAKSLIATYQSDPKFGGVMLWEATGALATIITTAQIPGIASNTTYFQWIKKCLLPYAPTSTSTSSTVTSTTHTSTSTTSTSVTTTSLATTTSLSSSSSFVLTSTSHSTSSSSSSSSSVPTSTSHSSISSSTCSTSSVPTSTSQSSISSSSSSNTSTSSTSSTSGSSTSSTFSSTLISSTSSKSSTSSVTPTSTTSPTSSTSSFASVSSTSSTSTPESSSTSSPTSTLASSTSSIPTTTPGSSSTSGSSISSTLSPTSSPSSTSTTATLVSSTSEGVSSTTGTLVSNTSGSMSSSSGTPVSSSSGGVTTTTGTLVSSTSGGVSSSSGTPVSSSSRVTTTTGTSVSSTSGGVSSLSGTLVSSISGGVTSTTGTLVSSSSGGVTGTPTSSQNRGSTSPSSIEYTTSTFRETKTFTVTSCAPTVTNCPAGPHVATVVVDLYTTVCPVTAIQTPGGSVILTSTPAGTHLTTVYSTFTISKCPASVTNCPIGSVTSSIVSVYTTPAPSDVPTSKPTILGTPLPGSTEETTTKTKLSTLTKYTTSTLVPVSTATVVPIPYSSSSVPVSISRTTALLPSSATSVSGGEVTSTPIAFEGAGSKMNGSAMFAAAVFGVAAFLMM